MYFRFKTVGGTCVSVVDLLFSARDVARDKDEGVDYFLVCSVLLYGARASAVSFHLSPFVFCKAQGESV